MDVLFGLDRVSPHDEGLTHVGTYYDAPSLAVAESLLDGAGIAYLKKERGVGAALTVVAGFNMYGTDVFVKDEDAEAAAALLTPPAEGGENTDAQEADE